MIEMMRKPNLNFSHIKRACPVCKTNAHMSSDNVSVTNPLYICGACGEIWNYDNVLFRPVRTDENVGRILERALGKGRKADKQKEEEKDDGNKSEEMLPPPGWQKEKEVS